MNKEKLIEKFNEKCDELSNLRTSGINTGGFIKGSPEVEDWYLSSELIKSFLLESIEEILEEVEPKEIDVENIDIPKGENLGEYRFCESLKREGYNKAIADLKANIKKLGY